MRIFKNRGDIYFSKVNKEKSAEQKILLIALLVIVVFTVIFILVLSIKNDFSVKKFFAPENVSMAENVTDNDIQELPEVSGKNNFMTIVHKNENLLFTVLIQVDMDNPSYKVSVLKADTEIEKNSIKDIYAQSGAENVKNAVMAYLGIDIDYYISMDSADFSEFFNSLGEINYPILNEIKHRENKSPVNYTLKIKAGEQQIDGSHFINLIRYYIDTENSISQANDLFLAALSQQMNSANFENKEDLFKTFVMLADTDITIRDFSNAGDELSVMCSDMAAMSVYNAETKYNKNKINSDSLKSVKSYFVK